MGRPQVTVKKIHSLTGHRDSVFTLAPAGSPHQFFSSGGDGQVAEWNLENPNEGRLIAKIPTSVYALHYWKAENTLVVGQNTEGIHLIDLGTREERGSLQLTKEAIFDIQMMGSTAWVACGDGTVVVVNAQNLQILDTLSWSKKSARSIAIHPEQNELAIGYSDHSVRIVDVDTHALKQTIPAHTNSVFTVVYDPQGRWLLSGSRDARFKVWRAQEGEYSLYEEVIAHMYAINHITFRPDGRYFATGSMDKAVKVWDADTFQLLKVIDKARHAGHGTSVNKLWWSTFDQQLVSGSDDRTVSVWDITIEAQEI
ncbi:MAG: WD40 repeat domain-containing protein [Bacteroidota bacterium]